MLSGLTSQLGNLSGLIGNKNPKESTTTVPPDDTNNGSETAPQVTTAGDEPDSRGTEQSQQAG